MPDEAGITATTMGFLLTKRPETDGRLLSPVPIVLRCVSQEREEWNCDASKDEIYHPQGGGEVRLFMFWVQSLTVSYSLMLLCFFIFKLFGCKLYKAK